MNKFRLCFPLILTVLVLSSLSCEKKKTKTPSLIDNYPNRIKMDKSKIRPDDGDSFHYDTLTIRILGIDAPEIIHREHGYYEDQPLGRDAAAMTNRLMRQAKQVSYVPYKRDMYGRMLAHVFVDRELLSEKLLRVGLAYETITRYGDNGFPDIAEYILEVSEASPQPQFEAPWKWRQEHRKGAEVKEKQNKKRPNAIGTY
jgi:endonuclease YncB( thermonuclease family)